MGAFFAVTTIVLFIYIPIWQEKRRKDFSALLEKYDKGSLKKFRGRIFWGGIGGGFKTGNDALDAVFKRYQDEVTLLRFAAIGSFIAMIFSL